MLRKARSALPRQFRLKLGSASLIQRNNPVSNHRPQTSVGRGVGEYLAPKPNRFLRVAGTGFGQSQEKGRRRITGRKLRSTIECEAGRRSERACMVSQRVTETDPQFIVVG